MDLLTFALIVVACYTIYYYFKNNLDYFKNRDIPYYPAWPLLGNMATPFFRRKHISDLVRDMYNYNPDAKYIGGFDFVRPVIVLRDLELIKSVAIKNFDSFPDHKSFVDDSLDPLFGGNLFNIAGDRWKEARNLLSPAFTSSKMKGMFELIAQCAENFVKYLEERPASENKMIATKDLFTRYTNDAIATCAFGIAVDSMKDPKNQFYVLGREATNLEGLMTVKFFIARAFPQILKFFRITFVRDEIVKFFKDIVGATVAMRDEQGISRPDMIQLMMDARGKESKHLKLDLTEMTAQAFIFFFGGFDTTSTQMCIIAHLLAIHPNVQRKLQEEIDEVMRKHQGKPTYEDINGMAYLDAVFNESMRRHTQVGFIDRLCTKKFELPPALPGGKGFTVLPGMNIWIPAIGIHMDPKYYDDPETFDPERYYEKKVSINDVTNLGFGIGPRACIGNRFAIMETKLMLFFLLSKFNLVANEKTAKPFVYSKHTFSIVAKGGYWLGIEKRN
ncbi:cytochrome P450 9AG4 [Nasonia vitripennis]|uniref:Cytochrome P450 n=1 Tax=Nasonia vitripennis TaxID=7425 RepID=A0A7M6UFX9_NASVI|nr:cytochrome P450 9AG4 [Nasonia vitripennis]